MHFDPLNAVLIVIAIVGALTAWKKRETTLENDSKWHTEWIKTHSKECDERESKYTNILTELQKGNAHLTTLTESQGERLTRIESTLDRKR